MLNPPFKHPSTNTEGERFDIELPSEHSVSKKHLNNFYLSTN